MNLDSIFNVIFFIVGLAIGLLQLYIGQHQFEVQQREKMDELRKILTDIQQRLAILEETTTQRAFEVQDKLIGLVAGEEAVAEFTEDTSKQVQELISNELKKAGIQDSIERTKALETKLAEVLERSASSLVDYATQESAPMFSTRERQIVELLSQGYTYEQIGGVLGLTRNTVQVYMYKLRNKLGMKNRDELVEFYLSNVKGHGSS